MVRYALLLVLVAVTLSNCFLRTNVHQVQQLYRARTLYTSTASNESKKNQLQLAEVLQSGVVELVYGCSEAIDWWTTRLLPAMASKEVEKSSVETARRSSKVSSSGVIELKDLLLVDRRHSKMQETDIESVKLVEDKTPPINWTSPIFNHVPQTALNATAFPVKLLNPVVDRSLNQSKLSLMPTVVPAVENKGEKKKGFRARLRRIGRRVVRVVVFWRRTPESEAESVISREKLSRKASTAKSHGLLGVIVVTFRRRLLNILDRSSPSWKNAVSIDPAGVLPGREVYTYIRTPSDAAEEIRNISFGSDPYDDFIRYDEEKQSAGFLRSFTRRAVELVRKVTNRNQEAPSEPNIFGRRSRRRWRLRNRNADDQTDLTVYDKSTEADESNWLLSRVKRVVDGFYKTDSNLQSPYVNFVRTSDSTIKTDSPERERRTLVEVVTKPVSDWTLSVYNGVKWWTSPESGEEFTASISNVTNSIRAGQNATTRSLVNLFTAAKQVTKSYSELLREKLVASNSSNTNSTSSVQDGYSDNTVLRLDAIPFFENILKNKTDDAIKLTITLDRAGRHQNGNISSLTIDFAKSSVDDVVAVQSRALKSIFGSVFPVANYVLESVGSFIYKIPGLNYFLPATALASDQKDERIEEMEKRIVEPNLLSSKGYLHDTFAYDSRGPESPVVAQIQRQRTVRSVFRKQLNRFFPFMVVLTTPVKKAIEWRNRQGGNLRQRVRGLFLSKLRRTESEELDSYSPHAGDEIGRIPLPLVTDGDQSAGEHSRVTKKNSSDREKRVGTIPEGKFKSDVGQTINSVSEKGADLVVGGVLNDKKHDTQSSNLLDELVPADSRMQVRIGRTVELKTPPSFINRNIVPLPSRADFAVLASRRVEVAIEAAIAITSPKDAEEFLKDVGLEPLISAVLGTASYSERIDVSRAVKGLCRLTRHNHSIANKLVESSEMIEVLCDYMEAPLRKGFRAMRTPTEQELLAQKECTGLIQRIVRSSDQAVEYLRTNSRLIKVLRQIVLSDDSTAASVSDSSRDILALAAGSSATKGKTQRKMPKRGNTTVVEFNHLTTTQMARVASWGIGGVPWKPKQPNQKGIRILSFDGGGTRGVISIAYMKELMKEIGVDANPHELFDIICGTSTGGIIAALFGTQRRTVNEAETLYDDFIDKVFASRSNLKLVTNQAAYDEVELENILDRICGDQLILDSNQHDCAQVFLISTKVNNNPPQPQIWRNYNYPTGCKSKYPGAFRVNLRTAVRATTAAPTFFTPVQWEGGLYVDGALVANNPTAIAIQEAKSLYPGVPVEMVVSIGTGYINMDRKVDSLGWNVLVDNLIASSTDTEDVHKLLADLLPEEQYFRFNPLLRDNLAIDEKNKSILTNLKRVTREDFRNTIDGPEGKHYRQLIKTLRGEKNPYFRT